MESKQRKVSISIYQTPARPAKPPRSVTIPATGRYRRPTTHGFDRRAMLLAYAQELRRIHGDRRQVADWRKWKIAYATHHGMRRGSRWEFRVAGVRRRRRRKRSDYERLEVVDGGGGKEKQRWRSGLVCKQWRLVVRWISRRWRLLWRKMGSYFKSKKYHYL